VKARASWLGCDSGVEQTVLQALQERGADDSRLDHRTGWKRSLELNRSQMLLRGSNTGSNPLGDLNRLRSMKGGDSGLRLSRICYRPATTRSRTTLIHLEQPELSIAELLRT
jgi:hypothetical protein